MSNVMRATSDNDSEPAMDSVQWPQRKRSPPPKAEAKPGLFSPKSLPSLLRRLGTVTLLASVSIYILQGWDVGSDLMRYLLLLAHTVGLAVVGVLCSRWLKEQKGARLLLMIALVFISANFAILGGFALSLWGQPVAGLYGAVTWVISSSSSSLLALAGALLVLVPLTFLGFNVAARRSAKTFSWVFLISNFMLLLPTRDEFALSTIMLGLLGLVIYTITKARAVDVTLATREGLIARLILFVPLGIMLGRNMMHSVGEVIPLIVGFSIFVLMRQISMSLQVKNFIRTLLEFFSLVPVIIAGSSMAALLSVQFGASFAVSILGFSVVASVMLFELSIRASGGRGFYSVIASMLLAGCFVSHVLLVESSFSALTCIVAGLALTGFGYMSERRAALVLGCIMAVIGVSFYLMGIFHNFDLNGWFSMAFIGVGAIVLGSYIEKQGEQALTTVRRLKASLDAWGY